MLLSDVASDEFLQRCVTSSRFNIKFEWFYCKKGFFIASFLRNTNHFTDWTLVVVGEFLFAAFNWFFVALGVLRLASVLLEPLGHLITLLSFLVFVRVSLKIICFVSLLERIDSKWPLYSVRNATCYQTLHFISALFKLYKNNI